MSDFTDYTEQAIRDWFSQGTTMPAAPSTLYVALHTSDPGETPDGSTEVSAGDYARVGVTAGSGWNTITSGGGSGFENASEVSFGEATNNWGTISHVSIWDASTGGNPLAAYAVSSSKAIDTGDEAVFPAGDLSFTVD